MKELERDDALWQAKKKKKKQQLREQRAQEQPAEQVATFSSTQPEPAASTDSSPRRPGFY